MSTQIAIYIMQNTPTDERVEELGQHASLEHFQGAPYTTRLTHELPEGQPVHLIDQLETKKNQNPGSIYLIIEPESF